MPSLNEGFELDEELDVKDQQEQPATVADNPNVRIVKPSEFADTVFENPEAGDVPELDSDVALVTAVSDKVQDLDYLRADIIKSNGMNKTFALEAERLMPGFVGEHRPIGFFTDIPTKTNYKLSLEAIDSEKKSLIRQIWDAIMRFMKEAVEWAEQFAKKLTGSLDRAEKTETFFKDSTTESNLDQAQRSFTDPKNIISKVDMLVKDKQSESFKGYKQSLEEKLSEAKPRLDKLYETINSNDAIYAVVNKNSAVKVLLDLGEKADEVVSGYGAIDKKWLQTMLLASDDENDTKRNAEYALHRVHEPASKAGHMSFDHYATYLKSNLKQRPVEYSSKNMPLSKLFSTFTVTFKSRKMDAFKEVIEKAVVKLKAIQKTIFDFTSDSETKSVQGKGDTSKLSEVIRALHKELRAVLMLFKFSGDMFAAWIWMGDALSSAVNDHHRRVMSQTQDLPEEYRKKLRDYFGIKEDKTFAPQAARV